MNRITAILLIVLGGIGATSAVTHGYILGVVADRAASDQAFQGSEQATLTILEGLGLLAGLALVVIGVVSLPRRTSVHVEQSASHAGA